MVYRHTKYTVYRLVFEVLSGTKQKRNITAALEEEESAWKTWTVCPPCR